eukprot:766664-Hanusia_phi.AAC.6
MSTEMGMKISKQHGYTCKVGGLWDREATSQQLLSNSDGFLGRFSLSSRSESSNVRRTVNMPTRLPCSPDLEHAPQSSCLYRHACEAGQPRRGEQTW